MATKCVINVGLADVWAEEGRKRLLRTLTWGDDVSVVKQTASHVEIETFGKKPWFSASYRNGHEKERDRQLFVR